MKEIWKLYHETNCNPTYKYYVKYEVSNLGRVKRNGVILELDENKRYYQFFSGDFVHRAVAELFIPNPENKPEVDHIDCNTHNNNVNNLRWVTRIENMNNTITKENIGKSSKARKVSDETRRKMSESHKGFKHTEETRIKMSESHKGERNPFYGKHHTEEIKKQISISCRGKAGRKPKINISN